MPRCTTRAKSSRAAFVAASLALQSALATLTHAQTTSQSPTSATDRPPSTAVPSTAAPSAATPTSGPSPASANPASPIPTGDPLSDLRLIPIDPGTEDISRLRQSGRQMPVDLRKPLNFEQVYRVEGDLSRLGVLGVSPLAGQAMYARASGGLVAIFPQSEYVRTRQGPFPVVPANTTFLLGSIQTPTTLTAPGFPSSATSRVTAASAAQRVDTRATTSLPPSQPASQSTPLPTPQPTEIRADKPRRDPPSIWNSEVTRRSRLSQLLAEAKAAEAQPAAPNPAPSQPAPSQPAPTPASDP